MGKNIKIPLNYKNIIQKEIDSIVTIEFIINYNTGEKSIYMSNE